MPYLLKMKATDAEATEFISLGDLAELCGRKKISLKKLMERGLFPEANYRTPSSLIKTGAKQGQQIKGYRLYSKNFLVPKVVKFMKTVQQGKAITPEQQAELKIIFQSEVDHFSS